MTPLERLTQLTEGHTLTAEDVAAVRAVVELAEAVRRAGPWERLLREDDGAGATMLAFLMASDVRRIAAALAAVQRQEEARDD